MKFKVFALFAAMIASVLVTGCVGTVDGRTQGGVPFRKDKITSRYERTVPQVFDAARTVLSSNGVLTSDNRVNNSLAAKVDTRTVYVIVSEDEPTVSRVTVQVRTAAGGADIDLASEIDKQIALRLATQPGTR